MTELKCLTNKYLVFHSIFIKQCFICDETPFPVVIIIFTQWTAQGLRGELLADKLFKTLSQLKTLEQKGQKERISCEFPCCMHKSISIQLKYPLPTIQHTFFLKADNFKLNGNHSTYKTWWIKIFSQMEAK